MSSHWQGDLVSGLITLAIATLVIHVAARMVIDRGGFLPALLTALLGSILAVLVSQAVGGTLGLVLAIATWAFIAAVFFRTQWVKGAIIGVVAWIIWFLVSIVVRWVMAA